MCVGAEGSEAETTYTYVPGLNGATTPLVQTISQNGLTLTYTYDDNGNTNGHNTDDIRQQAIQQTEMEKQLQSLRHKKRELYERFASEEISQDEYLAGKQRCNESVQQIQNTLRILVARREESQTAAEAGRVFAALRSEVMSSGSLTQTIAEKTIKKVIVFHDHRIEIEYAVQDFLRSGNGTADVLPG